MKRRFIAGAVCPRCAQMDKIVMYDNDSGRRVRECVSCGYRGELDEQGNISELPTRVNEPRPGEPKAEDAHAYAGDLDVFGRGGLLQSIDTTRTREARALLARWLAAPASPEEIRHRQSAARELATKTDKKMSRDELAAIIQDEGDDVPEEHDHDHDH